jgi:hypothetical protein
MDWSFGDVLLTMLAFFFWFTFVWMFVGVFADIFRREDLSGWGKAGWLAVICLMPFFGVLIYMISRPKSEADMQVFERGGAVTTSSSTADEIAKLSQLHQSGALSDTEFAGLKAKAMA